MPTEINFSSRLAKFVYSYNFKQTNLSFTKWTHLYVHVFKRKQINKSWSSNMNHMTFRQTLPPLPEIPQSNAGIIVAITLYAG